MTNSLQTIKNTLKNPYVIGGTAVTLSLLALAKRYFNGGVCKVDRDLTGKVVVITGGNAGIGKATIEELAKKRCTIIFGARDVTKSENFLKELKSKNQNYDVTFYPLDLADLKSIEEFSEKVMRQVNHVDILVNNAAVFLLPKQTLTRQRFQMHMGVNHLGHFYLTYKLWPLIKQGHKPRIINVSALAHRGFKYPHNENIPIDFSNLHLFHGYKPALGYIRSKIANILFTKQLQRRMDQSDIEGYSYSLHPGVVRTQILREINWGLKILNIIFLPFTLFFLKDAKQGAQTTLYTILEDESKLTKGGYYSDCKQSQVSQFAGNMDNAKKLWEVSEQELNISFKI